MLLVEQKKQFLDEGMLCIPEFLAHDQVESVLDKAHALLADFDVESHPKTLFSTSHDNHIGDQYFLDLLDKISFFFDTDAIDDQGKLIYPKEVAINKIGHGLHMKDKLFHLISFDTKVKDIARKLDYKDPRILQSMLIFKHPVQATKIRDNEVPPHQDGTFLYTEPSLAIGFWYALEDVTKENGCLYYAPGSHKIFPIRHRFVRNPEGGSGCTMIGLEGVQDPADREKQTYVPVECKAGSLVLIHNLVLHKLEKNNSEKSRFVYAFHVVDGVAKYDECNWLQVPPSGGTNFSKLYEE